MASFGIRTLEASLNAWLVLGVGLATRCSGVWTLALGVAASRNRETGRHFGGRLETKKDDQLAI